MRYHRLIVCALLVVAGFTACVTESERPRVRAGMTREELRLRFGEPLRVERLGDGSEDWYYPFTAWSAPKLGGETYRDPFEPNLSTVSVTATSSRVTQERPIHLSAEGRVWGQIPAGRIEGR